MFEKLFKRARYLFPLAILILFYSITKPVYATQKLKLQSPTSSVSIQKSDIGQSRTRLRQYKNQLSLKPEQREMCLGLVLGDASIQTQNNSESYRLKFEVGEKNLEYLEHIQGELDEFILAKPNPIVRTNKNGHEVKTFQLQTISHSDFNSIANGFKLSKEQKRKAIDYNFLYKELTHRSVAYWFMDDGGKLDYTTNEGKGIVFNTQNFEQQEVQQLCDILNKRFKYKTWVKKNKGKYVVAVSGESYEDFIKNVSPYIIPSMQHKLPKPRKS